MTITAEQKKYMDIVRLGHKSTVGVLEEGDYIIVQEKLDGANASFKKDNDKIRVFSRNTELDESNNLRGFYQWVQENVNIDDLTDGFIYFGEWLVKHKLDYGINGGQQFYLFDVYNDETAKYLSFGAVAVQATFLNVQLVPIFYAGIYKGFDHLKQFAGKSVLGDQGEGVVVKNVSYQDRNGRQMFVKLVSDAFREVQSQKAPKDPNFQSEESLMISQVLTKQRVEKLLYKLIDEGLLNEKFGIEDMGAILKLLSSRVYDDIMKEEEDLLNKYEEKDVRRSVGKKLPAMVKSIISEFN